jgi:anti-sigma regulatory factor (Ser/Thr protein kinase)
MSEPPSPSEPPSIQIHPDSSEIARALEWLEAQAERAGLPMRAMFALNLALDETLANIVMHGFKPDPSNVRDPDTGAPAVRVICDQDATLFHLEVRDNGTAFDPTQQASQELASSLEEATLGGHGLRLMRHFLQGIDYRRERGWNVLRMSVRRDDPGPGQTAQD